MDVDRVEFGEYVQNLDGIIEGGVPKGSWVSIFGTSGSYKTLHSLAFILSGLKKGDKVVYLSTEENWVQLKQQIKSLGWHYKAYEAYLSSKTLRSKDFGLYDIVWIDNDSVRHILWIINEEIKKRNENTQHKYEMRSMDWRDPNLYVYAIMLGLEAVGAIRKTKDSILDYVKKARVKDGYFGSKYALYEVNRDVNVRVVFDSVSPLITGRYSLSGKILMDIRRRLESPNTTYIITSHVSKTTSEELGSQIGHVVDGRIKLWQEIERHVSNVYGLIAKMRLTHHSRVVHNVSITGSSFKVIKWEPVEVG